MGNPKNLLQHPNLRSNGFDKRPEDARKGGRKKGIKGQLQELLQSEGEYLIKANEVVEVREDGSVVVKLPRETTLAHNLLRLASKKNLLGLRAIESIINHLEGKPRQSIGFSNEPPEPFTLVPPPPNPHIQEGTKEA